MKVLFTGGRDRSVEFEVLDELRQVYDITHVVHGGARGVDTSVNLWALSCSLPITAVPGEWDKWGGIAGHMRNQRMLEHKPDLVIAFPGRTGTADMVERATAAGVKVVFI